MVKKLGEACSVEIPMLRVLGISTVYEDNELLQIIRDHYSEICTIETNLKIIQHYQVFKI